ncbi:Hypothetical predicted protein [Paramuricea clavata]|uniref:Uncharacterized protein n=1 Tax=Paramuricea clavata TaxID=317549 RepID=A0A6S7IFN5_PARCT|nr:Hypothetical predicted protein [Paramuricea clavata]
MKMIFPATILISSMLVPLVFSGTINAPKKNCRCRRSDAFYTNGLCLRSLPCKKNQILPSMLRDRQLGNKIVVCNQKVYRAYPVMTKRSRRCPVAGTLYNLKFNVCVRMLKCSEKECRVYLKVEGRESKQDCGVQSKSVSCLSRDGKTFQTLPCCWYFV